MLWKVIGGKLGHIIPEAYTFDDIQIIPKYSKVLTRSHCSLKSYICDPYTIDLPIVSSPMDTVTEWEMAYALWGLGGVGFIHRFMTIDEQVKQVELLREKFRQFYISKNSKGNVGITTTPQVGIRTSLDPAETFMNHQLVGVAIGVTDDYYERVVELYDNYNVKTFLFDVAHGHHVLVKDALKKIRKRYNSITLIAGSIATKDAAKDLIKWGATGLRVGIGNGSLCETRIRTGVGVPQATALADVCSIANEQNITVIADGGIRTPGDAAKAIGLGADLVMLGSLLAGTKETPGRLIRVGNFPDEQLFKQYRGSASQSSKLDRGEDGNIEGNSKLIPYKGKVKRIIEAVTDGIKSSMSYVGASTLLEFRNKVEFVQATRAAQIEAQPHLLLK